MYVISVIHFERPAAARTSSLEARMLVLPEVRRIIVIPV